VLGTLHPTPFVMPLPRSVLAFFLLLLTIAVCPGLPRPASKDYKTYRLQEGDKVFYQVLEEKKAGVSLVVGADGAMNIPGLGKMQALGKTCIELALEIEPQLEEKGALPLATVFIQLDPQLTLDEVADANKRPPSIPSGSLEFAPESDVEKSLPPALPRPSYEYTLKVGDQIRFRILEDKDEGRLLVVSESGEVMAPLVGRVRVLGKTCNEVAQDLKHLLEGRYYNSATVVIQLDAAGKTRGKVYVYGQVRQPGAQEVGENATVSKLVMAAGGFTEFADRTKVRVIRKIPATGKDREFAVDVQSIFENGKTENDLQLEPEDYVLVAQLPIASHEKIYIYGQVRSPGAQDAFGGRLTLSKAILNAGGFSSFANSRKVKIFRKDIDGQKKEITVDVLDVLQKGNFENDITLEPGDYVMVPEKFINF
jgi:protein involved in polysaccharide export with SLBB domain